MPDIQRVTPETADDAAETPALSRQQIFSDDDVRILRARMGPDTTSGWHHHNDNDNYVFFAAGEARVEFVTDDGSIEERRFTAGEFMYVPPRVVHRDVNPADEEQIAVLALIGDDPVVTNVEDPTG